MGYIYKRIIVIISNLKIENINKKLIQNVVTNARIPVIETGSGVSHLYVDKEADLKTACKIAENAKIQRPSVCNAIECIVVHKEIADDFLPMLENTFSGRVKLHADETAHRILHRLEALENAGLITPKGAEFLHNLRQSQSNKLTPLYANEAVPRGFELARNPNLKFNKKTLNRLKINLSDIENAAKTISPYYRDFLKGGM